MALTAYGSEQTTPSGHARSDRCYLFVPGRSFLAQAPANANRRIDIHQHFVSPSFLATLTARNAKTPVPGLAAWKDYSPARAVEGLDPDRRGDGDALDHGAWGVVW